MKTLEEKLLEVIKNYCDFDTGGKFIPAIPKEQTK